jgi:hypothetical protein
VNLPKGSKKGKKEKKGKKDFLPFLSFLPFLLPRPRRLQVDSVAM